MDRPCKQLLARPRFAAQQHRQIASRHQLDLLRDLLDRGAFTNDPRDSLVLGRVLLFQLLLQPVAFFHQALTVPLHHDLQRHGLPHQVGNHGQVAHIFIQRAGRGLVAHAFDCQRANGAVLALDRHSDKRAYLRRTLGLQLAPLSEQRAVGHVAHHQRHSRDHNLPHSLLRKPFKVFSGLCLVPARAHNGRRPVFLVQQGDQSAAHVQKAVQQVHHAGERRLQPRRPRQHLRDLVDAHQRRVRTHRRRLNRFVTYAGLGFDQHMPLLSLHAQNHVTQCTGTLGLLYLV